MPMIDVLRSGVNTWECDQMGHLNVRHYFARAKQGLARLALELGLPPSRLREQGLVLRAREQHVRFLRELRPGASHTMRAGVVDANAERLRVYEELSFAQAPELAATMLMDVMLVRGADGRELSFSEDTLERARALAVEVPDGAVARGIPPVPPRPAPVRDEALALDLAGAYLAPVPSEDCDAHGAMEEAAFMGRIADGIGHFFLKLGNHRAEGIGGAALEYRYVFHERPRVGDLIEVRSGLKALGSKTFHMCHWVFNLETGRCAATSEAVAVSFDLNARKAVEIPAEARAAMRTKIVPGLTL